MDTDVSEIYRNDLRFLLRLKEAVGILHNRIHDNLALIAIEYFKQKHPDLAFNYTNAGAAGIDITGRNARDQIRVVAEVKTTLPDVKGRLRGPQIKNMRKDLNRLNDHHEMTARYLVLLSSSTKAAVKRQLHSDDEYPSVEIINALDEHLAENVNEED